MWNGDGLDYKRLIFPIIVVVVLGFIMAAVASSLNNPDNAFTGAGKAPMAKGIGDTQSGHEFTVGEATYQIGRSRLGDVAVALLGTSAEVDCTAGPHYCEACDYMEDKRDYPRLPDIPDNPKVVDIYKMKIGPNGTLSVNVELDGGLVIYMATENRGKSYLPASECPIVRIQISKKDGNGENVSLLCDGIGIGSELDAVMEAFGDPDWTRIEDDLPTEGSIACEYYSGISFEFDAASRKCNSMCLKAPEQEQIP